jgi:PAS domain S-box-containing protein
MRLSVILVVLTLLSALSTFTGGYFYYSSLKEAAYKDAQVWALQRAESLKESIVHIVMENRKSTRALAGLDDVRRALEGADAQDIDRANLILDHFRKALEIDVCYLMDATGKTIASSNRLDPDSFLGKNYAFRPYFQQAMQGDSALYLAVGVTSGKRGIYCSHPVEKKDGHGPAGVVVIKSSLHTVEKNPDDDSVGAALLVNERGVIFVSSREDWLYQGLWDLKPEEAVELSRTMQFGAGPWKSIGFKKKDRNTVIDESGNEHLFCELDMAVYPGWSVIYVGSIEKIYAKIIEPLVGIGGRLALVLSVLVGVAVLLLYQTAATDIKKRKLAEEALRESEGRYRTLVQSVQDGLFIILDSRMELVNDAFARMIGYDVSDVIGMHFQQLVAPEDREMVEHRYRRRQLGEQVPSEYEFHMLHKDGRTRVSVNMNVGSVEHGGKMAAMGTVKDITARKRAEEERSKMQKLESIGVLAGGIAHDFNNLLTGIMGNISLAHRLSEGEERLHRCLEEAEKASARAKDLTQQLLTFSRGGAPIKRKSSIEGILRETCMFALSGSKSVCKFDIPQDSWVAEVDEGQIGQVISNIVINADQAMPKGGTICMELRRCVLDSASSIPVEAGRYIRIGIQDQGEGISKENLPKVFDPYFSTKEKGSGLGLATAYSIVKRHNGHIGVESNAGSGTALHVYLPAFTGDMELEKEGESPQTVKGTAKILVMDDDELVRLVAGEMLTYLGYEVERAPEGQEAIEMYLKARRAGRPFDAILVDLTIPGGMGGKETVERLLELDPQVRAIVSSGYSNDPVMAEFRKYGFSSFVLKPYKLDELSEALRVALSASPNSDATTGTSAEPDAQHSG